MKNNPSSLVGKSLTLSFEVEANHTAAVFSHSPEERYANVLGTPFLIAQIERVCAKLIEPLLEQGQVSVGAHIDVRHLASTAVGTQYTVTAELTQQRWGVFTFTVEAKDSVGIIGKGQIIRAIASLDSVNDRAQQAV